MGLCLLTSTAASASTPVIFDNDMAIDDWSTMLFLAKRPELDLIAVTVAGSGEAHCEPGVANALALLQLAGEHEHVPVSCGDDWPLDGYFVFPVPWQEDMDRLSGVEIPPSERSPAPMHAVDLIHTALAEATEPVVILATGPMTNLAQWLQRYPQDRDKVSRIVIMGGNLKEPGNIIVPGFTDGHPNVAAEWNLYVDPLAADMLFRSGIEVEMVGLDVTNDVRVTAEFAQEFKALSKTPVALFWDQILDQNDWFIASGEYYFWDVLAALVVLDRERFCGAEMMALGVSHEAIDASDPTDRLWEAGTDREIGPLRWDGQPRRHLDAGRAGVVEPVAGEPHIRVCLTTDAAGAFTLFTETLTGP